MNHKSCYIETGVVFLVIVTFLFSCEHKPRLYPGNPDTGIDTSGSCNPDTVYFQNEILPIIQSNCASPGCHDAITHKEGIRLDNYNAIMSNRIIFPGYPESGDFVNVITTADPGDRMPPGGQLPTAAIDKLKRWIAQGARNNYCLSKCDTASFTYSQDILKIININCVACHSSGNVLLNSYSNVKTLTDNGRLLGALMHLPGYRPMPSPATSLSACEITKFKKWIANGAPNN